MPIPESDLNKLTAEQRELIDWLYVHNSISESALLLGAMTAHAVHDPALRFFDAIAEARRFLVGKHLVDKGKQNT